ncbi:MAG TPA: cyclic pyranopterin monophosphate synthase MoaC [Thermoanaerobaculia bacterium]|nr:cyclic pyranopterin monophosphate synthase MoaC [Thermoanaerobaculia bacterium]
MNERRDPDPQQLSHVRADGTVAMVDVSGKSVTSREAVAAATVQMSPVTIRLLRDKALPKGDVLTTARVAGILAAKQASSLIPLTHPLPITFIDIEFEIGDSSVEVTATTRCDGKTGVEIEAMTACAVACLTIYDMCKSAQKDIVITDLRLLRKSGGKSGTFERG